MFSRYQKLIFSILLPILIVGGIFANINTTWAFTYEDIPNIENYDSVRDHQSWLQWIAGELSVSEADTALYEDKYRRLRELILQCGNDEECKKDVIDKWGKSFTVASNIATEITGTSTLQVASMTDILANIFAWLLYMIASAIGWIVSLLMGVLMRVLTYKVDINLPAVNEGWTVIRDTCNNFFIVILMAIAISTILRLPQYSKSLLPKLLIYAVLINFSKLFCGLLIDASQIMMLAFAVPLTTDNIGGNIFLSAMGIPDFFNASTADMPWSEGGGLVTFDLIATLIFAIIALFIAAVVIVVIIAVLIVRVVVLLFLTVLSPAAWFLNTFPKGGQYASKWWDAMIKYLTIGPVMLFFLWLSFMMMGFANSGAPGANNNQITSQATQNAGSNVSNNATVFTSQAMDTDRIIGFMLIIIMLLTTLRMAQQSGGIAGSFAGKGLGFINSARKKAVGKLADVSGVSTVRDVGKQLLANRKQRKDEARKNKIAGYAGGIQAGIDKTKQKVASGLTAAATGIKNISYGRNAKRLADRVEEDKKRVNRLDSQGIMNKIDKQEEFEHGGMKYKYDATTKDWDIEDASHPGRIVAHSLNATQLEKMLTASQNLTQLDDIKNKKDITDAAAGLTYSYDKKAKKWNAKNSSGTVVGSPMDDNQVANSLTPSNLINSVESRGNFVNNGFRYAYGASTNSWDKFDANGIRVGTVSFADRHKIYEDGGGITRSDIENREEELRLAREKAAAVERYVKRGLVGAATVTGAAATGGFSLLGLLGGAAGAAVGYGVSNYAVGATERIKGASEDVSNQSRNYLNTQVESIRKDLKELSNGQLTTKLDDYSLDKFTRMAVSMEALSRGILNDRRAQEAKKEIMEKSKGDKKITDSMDKELIKNHIGLSEMFTDLKDVTKRDKAMIKIREKVEGGSLNMKDLDQGSLKSMAHEFAESLSKTRFLSQFKDLSGMQQEAIKASLRDRVRSGTATYTHREKLAHLTDVGTAFNGDLGGRDKFIGKLSPKEIQDMIEGGEDAKINAIKTAIAGNQAMLSQQVRNAIAAGGTNGTKLRNALL